MNSTSTPFRATWHPHHELAPMTFDLVRVGRNEDGGYLVPRKVLADLTGCLSFGLGADWSFEKHLVRTYNGLIDPKNVVVFDASISVFGLLRSIVYMGRRTLYEIRIGRKSSERKFRFEDLNLSLKALVRYLPDFRFRKFRFCHIRKFVVSKPNKKNEISFQQALSYRLDPERTIVKIDIEGGEWDLFQRREDVFLISRAPALIIEFHVISRPEFLRLNEWLREHFWIAHLHGNTSQKCTEEGMPLNLEVTFVNKRFSPDGGLRRRLPIADLDFPGRNGELQYEIVFNS